MANNPPPVPPGNQALANQLAQLQQHVNQGFNQMNQRFNLMEQRFVLVETLRVAFRARVINKRVRVQLGAQFLMVPKYTAGHPFLNHPAIAGVAFAAGYNVGDDPPDGLVPRSMDQFVQVSHLPLIDLRRIVRGIYWFYNDDFLHVAANAGQANCSNALELVEKFLKDDTL